MLTPLNELHNKTSLKATLRLLHWNMSAVMSKRGVYQFISNTIPLISINVKHFKGLMIQYIVVYRS